MGNQSTGLASFEEALAHIKRETERVVEVAANSPLAAHVPTYPALTVEGLSAQIGQTLRATLSLVGAGIHTERATIDTPSGPSIVEWVRVGLEPLLLCLRSAAADEPQQPHHDGHPSATSIASMLAVEIGLHRWDLESVLGDHHQIPADLAIREINAALEYYVPLLARADVAPIGGTVQFQATDAAMRWALSVREGALQVDRVLGAFHAGDVRVSASAEDLALIVWKRWLPPRSGVEIAGSLVALKRLLSIDYIPDPRATAIS
jgi:hypothetical protein